MQKSSELNLVYECFSAFTPFISGKKNFVYNFSRSNALKHAFSNLKKTCQKNKNTPSDFPKYSPATCFDKESKEHILFTRNS